MKLVHHEWDFQIEFYENKIPVLVIENPIYFRQIVEDLLAQCSGEEGQLILSDNSKVLAINKMVELIINPIQLNVNQRKIINGLYKSMEEEVLNSSLSSHIFEIFSKSYQFMDEISSQIDAAITYHTEMECSKFFQFMDVKIGAEDLSMIEKLLQYVRLLKSFVFKEGVFVFVNLKTWFSAAELVLFTDQLLLEKINFILIESSQPYVFEKEMTWTVDKDLCFIY